MKKKNILSLVLCLVLGGTLLAGCSGGAGSAPKDKRTLTLEQTELTVVAGEEPVTLTPILSSGKGDFQWTSSDEEIVTVNQKGQVTGVTVGTATVTVECGTLEPAVCQVTVVLPEYMPVFTADATGEGISKTIASGKSIQLDSRITFRGEPVEAELTYTSRDSGIAKVSDEGVISGVKEGTTQIQAVAVYMDLEVHMTVDVTVLSE